MIFENLKKYYSIKEEIFNIEDLIINESLCDTKKNELITELDILKKKSEDLFLTSKKEETGLRLIH